MRQTHKIHGVGERSQVAMCGNTKPGFELAPSGRSDLVTCKACKKIAVQRERMDALESELVANELAAAIEQDQTRWPAWEGQEI